MLLKIVILIAAFCVVNGSVITNSHEDEPKTEIRQGVEDTNYNESDRLAQAFNSNPEDDTSARQKCDKQWCKKSCNRHGYWVGICEKNKCRSYHKKNFRELKTTESFEFEEPITVTDEVEGVGVFHSVLSDIMSTKASCVFQQCNKVCKSIGYRCGACRNQKCTCYKSKCPAFPIQPMKADHTKAEEADVIFNEDKTIEEPVLQMEVENTEAEIINEGEEMEELQDHASQCTILDCYFKCVSNGFKYGVCRKNKKNIFKCVCQNDN